MNGEREDWRDKLLEQGLRETVGGERAPDLTSRILAQVKTNAATEAPADRRRLRAGSPQRPRGLDFFAGALAAAALVAAALLFARGGEEPRQVPVQVLAGEVLWTGKGSSLRGGAGSAWSLPLDTGHRLAALGEAMAEARIAAMGVLGMSAGSELEVRKMDWKQFGGGAALGSITVAVIAGAISWNSGNQAITATGGDTVQLKGGAPVEAAQPAAPGPREQRLEKELATALTRIKELETEKERRVPVVSPIEGAASAPAGEEKATPALVARFTDDQIAEALRGMDWDKMGMAGKELVPLLVELLKRLQENPEDVPLDLAGQIQRWNGELVAQAKELIKHNVPGAGVNGAFTHPLVQANLVDAMLTKSGVPLSKDQQEAVGALARSYAEQDRAMRAGFGPETPTMRQYLTELEMKEKFWGELDQTLAPNQRNVISPAALRGSMMDMFSSGIVWAGFTKPMEVADRADLVVQMRDQVTRDLGLPAGESVRIEEVVRGWAQGFGDDYWKGAAGMGKPGGGRSEAVRAAARQQVALIDRILATVPLDERQRRKLIGQKTLFVPKLK